MAQTKLKCSVSFSKYLQKLQAAYKPNINEFLNNSTINGLRYFNRHDLSIAERLYFIIAFIAAVASSIFFVRLVAEKWSYSPTIISINPRPNFITDDPFPAVTICNMNQAFRSKVASLSKYSKEYAQIQMLCNLKADITMKESIKDWTTFGDLILNISQPCEQMMLACVFGGVQYNCTNLFHPILMDEGLCCVFNILDSDFTFRNSSSSLGFNVTYPPNIKTVGWTLEYGYQSPLPKYYSPMKVVGAGQSLGLNVILNVESEEYYCSSGNSIGFKITAHNPDEEPNIRETGLLISPGVESLIRIVPEKLEADETLRHLSAKVRNCIFENEYNLTVFAQYSYTNCMYECTSAVIKKHCGCENSYRNLRFSNLTTCSPMYRNCIEAVETESGCAQQCRPSCFSKQYEVDIFSSTLENTGMELKNPKFENMTMGYIQKNIAVVKMYINQNTYLSTKRVAYIGSVDVLSSIGGLICVFFGFSFISLAEFIYYICIRPWRSISWHTANESFRRNPYPLLGNRSKNRFDNPGKTQKYKLKSQRSLAMPQKVWHINKMRSLTSNGEEMRLQKH